MAFDTDANNPSGEDDDAFSNVFVRDAAADATTLVSSATGAGDGDSQDAAVSGDGRFVAFASSADNLSTDDVDPVTDIFVRDLAAGTTTLVSRASGLGGAGGDGTSEAPAISADGTRVAFHSGADNFSNEDDDFFNVFVRDLVAGTTTLVSRGQGASGAGANDDAVRADISLPA